MTQGSPKLQSQLVRTKEPMLSPPHVQPSPSPALWHSQPVHALLSLAFQAPCELEWKDRALAGDDLTEEIQHCQRGQTRVSLFSTHTETRWGEWRYSKDTRTIPLGHQTMMQSSPQKWDFSQERYFERRKELEPNAGHWRNLSLRRHFHSLTCQRPGRRPDKADQWDHAVARPA